MVLIFRLCSSFSFVWDEGESWSHFLAQSCPSLPPCVFMGYLKLLMERQREQLKHRSCRNLKRCSRVLFHPSNTVSLCKIKTVSYKTILNPFYTLALPVLKSSCEAYILNACPCTHSLNIHSEFKVLCFYSPTAGPYGKTTIGASCKGEEWGGAVYADLALFRHCPWELELP